jgi:hypothetical protein
LNNNSDRYGVGIGEVVEWRWQSIGEDGNRAMAVWEIIDSDNKIYLMSLNK